MRRHGCSPIGQGVTPPAVATAVLDARQRALSAPTKAAKVKQDKAERQAFKAELRQDADRLGRCAAEVAAVALERDGQAPTWCELGRAMGWSWWQWQLRHPPARQAGMARHRDRTAQPPARALGQAVTCQWDKL